LAKGKKIDGFKTALEMLQHMDLASQQTLLAELARKDPEMAVKLKSKLVTFDDLKYITASMLVKLWGQTKLEDWGLALRGSSLEVKNHILSLVSKTNKADLEDLLTGKPRPLAEVLKAQMEIMQVVMKMRERGEIVLSKEGSERYV
jgi:flagellar motor switch protein FliG